MERYSRRIVQWSFLLSGLNIELWSGCGAKSGLGDPVDVADATSELGHDAGIRIDAGRDSRADVTDARIEADVPPDDAPPDVVDSPPGVVDAPPEAPSPICLDSGVTAGWLWTTGGTRREEVEAIQPLSDGAVLVAGEFEGTSNFDVQPHLPPHTAVGSSDAFVAKLSCSGEPLWVLTWGGDAAPATTGWDDEAISLALAPDGAFLVAGQYCTSADFDPGPGVDQRTSSGCFDAYVTRFSPDGKQIWTRTLGGPGRDRISDVAVASDGRIAIVGQFEGTVDLDPGPGEELRTSNGSIDVFAASLTPDGQLLWVATWGGPATEFAPIGLEIDAAGSLLVSGQFEADVDFDPGPGVDVRRSAGADDAYVMKLARNGTREWAVTFGGTSSEFAPAIALDPNGALFVSGFFYGSADFDPGPGSDVHTNLGYYDSFLSKLDASGAHRWTRTWGRDIGSDAAQGHVLVAGASRDPDGDILVAGDFFGWIDFDPGPQRYSLGREANLGFVTAFSAEGTWKRTWQFSSSQDLYAKAVVALSRNDMLVAGSFRQSASFGLGTHVDSRTAGGDFDGFVLRFVER